MQHIAKEVREYLRAGDILIDRLKTGTVLSAEEAQYVESYTTRIRSLMNPGENITASKGFHITVRFGKSEGRTARD
jgi:hypothetical protein